MDYFDHRARQYADAVRKQVGKTVNGDEIDDQHIHFIMQNLNDHLAFCGSDTVLDLCCGNGIVTLRIASFVKRVLGIDFSSGLIDSARRNHPASNISYSHNDALELEASFFQQATKICMNEALQHFSPQMLDTLLANMHRLDKGTLFFISGIPDKERLTSYYDTDEKWQFYRQRELENKPHIGYWWDRKALDTIAGKNGFSFQFIPQNPELYTAYYRFDCLLEKR